MTTTPRITITTVPDALLIPESTRSGGRIADRVGSICAVAEPLLGIDRATGGRAWIRKQRGGQLFITASPDDTLFFACDHARAGQSRYRWELQPDGSRWGWLVEGAKQ